MSKRQPSATQSLMRIALAIDITVVFFGALVVRGVSDFPDSLVWIVSGIALVYLIVTMGLLRTPVGAWLGHVFHVGLLGAFWLDIAIGLSVLVPIGFWIFAAIRGPQLDALSGEADSAST